ncbi:MAG TPA: ABC transporter substrate-binding protein [Blastococcus sp.]|nr:ABC transporter substrate-binding protein [Blastococcus sp.]
MNSTRGLPRMLGAVLMTGVLLAGCGTDEPAEPGPAASGAAEDAFPVTLQTEFGETEVTERPERVVVLGLIDADAVLALGVTPVAVQQWLPQYAEYGVGPWAEDEIAEAVDSGETEVLANPGVVSYDLEQIAALQPDLLVAISANIDQTTFDQLSQLAPVVARPPGTVNFGVSLRDSTLAIGRALGLEDEAEDLVEQTEQAYADAAAEHPEFDGASASVMRPVDGGYSAWQSADVRQQIMAQLGFVVPSDFAAVDDGAFAATLSSERLDLLEADVLVVILPEGFEDPTTADPVLQTLDVVQRGDVVLLDAADVGGAMAYNTVLSAPTVIDELVPQLAEALGD